MKPFELRHLETTIKINNDVAIVNKTQTFKWGEVNDAVKNYLKIKGFKGKVVINECKPFGGEIVKKLSFNGECYGF